MFALHTYHHTVGAHEVLDGVTLLQELWIAGYIKLYLYAALLQFVLDGLAHLTGRSYWYR